MRKLSRLFALTFVFAVGFATLSIPASAQDEDPPSRVARLNYVQGSVSYQVSGDQNWVEADPNRPLTTGDNLWVDQNSRGEVHVGSTAIRMSSETGISFLTLDDRTVQLQLAQGTIEVHLRRLAPGEAFEIDTPNLSFTLTHSGEYRIGTDPNGGSSVIVVREGEGEVTGGGESWDLVSGQQYVFQGTDQLSYDASPVPEFDEFENWCQSRDDRENHAPSAKYVSRDVDGYYDLDDYGDWGTDPDYGAIWVPRGVAVGWAPYQVGHWVYVAPWGWTWVDEEPWGFAPFHYGRWAFVSGYWAWVPGPVVVRPVYAPALVAFVGGGGFSFAVGFGGGFSGVAWFPLGPRDVYVPGYHTSARYVETINITNTRVVNVTQVRNVYNSVVVNHSTTYVNNYTYARNARAVTAVSRDTFVNARPVSKAAVHLSTEQLQAARPIETAPIAPTRSSYMSATARVATAKPATPFEQRPVVARLNPAVSRRAPVYTNDSREFSQPNRGTTNQPNQGNDQQQNVQRGGSQQPSNTSPPSDAGFRPFQPPSGGNRSSTTAQQEQQQPRQNNARPSMTFTPPPKARDEMYDVHPPLNQKQAQPAKQEERRATPPAQQPKEENKKDK